MKRINILIVLVFMALASCKKGLDYPNTNVINPADVWTDSTMIEAYLNDIYGGCMPGWPLGSGANDDEGIGNNTVSLSGYLQGIVNAASTNSGLNYQYIDKANFFVDQLATVPTSVISTALKLRLTGEAKFWRAWTYWNMVSQIGGVPLILHTQDPTNPPSLNVPRSKTSVCITQIIQDLDSAALLLPATYSGTDYGRITSVAALGLKGRILLWYASPLFNPTNDPTRWQTAYNATLAAVQAANAAGYGLLPNYRAIWYSANKEDIMVNQYYYPDHYMNFNSVEPGSYNTDQPILQMLIAFPKRDGSPMEFDKTQLSNPAYNAQFLTDFYTNRDDRFYATIYCGGTVYPTPDMFPGQTAPRTWTFWSGFNWVNGATPSSVLSSSFQSNGQVAYQNLTETNLQSIVGDDAGITGFWERKGVDTTQTSSEENTGVAPGAVSWWSPMRYAELLMNYGECANEVGNTGAALNVLYQIRARANITAGTGNYGVTATSQPDIRTAYINERQVEFAFEGIRFGDLRRWKRYDILNTEGSRHALLLMLNPGAPMPAVTDNIMTASVRANFSAVYLDNLDENATTTQHYNLDLNHWFYALPPSQISVEPTMLPQNVEWGGTFDPLQ